MNTNNERSGKSDSKRQRLRVSIRFILIAMAILCFFPAYVRASPFYSSPTTQYIQIENHGDALTENLLTIRPTKASWIVAYCDTFTAEQLKILSQLSAAKFLSLNAWVESPTADAIRQLKGIRTLEHLDLGGFEELQYHDVFHIVDSMPKLTEFSMNSHAMDQSEVQQLKSTFPQVNFSFESPPDPGAMLKLPESYQFAPKQ